MFELAIYTDIAMYVIQGVVVAFFAAKWLTEKQGR